MVLLAWRRPSVTLAARGAVPARPGAGGRYVRPRAVSSGGSCCALPRSWRRLRVWALLPLIATRRLGLDADGYGLLFAALGLGAVVAALSLGRVTRHLSSNAVLMLAAAAFALAFGALAVVPNPWVAVPLLMSAASAGPPPCRPSSPNSSCFLPLGARPRHRDLLMVFSAPRRSSPRSGDWSPNTSARRGHPHDRGAGRRRDPRRPGAARAGQPAPGRAALSYGSRRGALEPERPPDRSSCHRVRGRGRPGGRLPRGHGADAPLTIAQRRLRWDLYRVGEHPDIFLEQFTSRPGGSTNSSTTGAHREDQDIETPRSRTVIGTPRTRHLLPGNRGPKVAVRTDRIIQGHSSGQVSVRSRTCRRPSIGGTLAV